jgi:hydrogenase expression/formation protein HypE
MTERILLSHGSGGRQTQELVRSLFAKHFTNPLLEAYGDAAILDLACAARTANVRLAFTTDSFVVQPLEFPGGDIGTLAICGTVNDLAVTGARPLWLSCGFIIEEGFELALLERIVGSMAREARAAGVVIVCGDTKVVERGAASGIFINTSGIGEIVTEHALSPSNIHVGDKLLVNGPIADHGIAILAARKELKLSTPVTSDCASLAALTQAVLDAAPNTRCMRDPTRGGVAASLNEWIENASFGIALNETTIPLNDSTKAICEMLGFDPLTIANEGKVLVAIPRDEANAALEAMRAHPLGKNAAIIGEVTSAHPAKVVMTTTIGTTRIIPMPSGELLPRIC